MARDFPPLRRTPLYEEIAERLRDLIVAQRLAPGDRLPSERDLAEWLGVSRTSVRQALASLRCDCGEQLEAALTMIDNAGEGVLLYLAQEGRGIDLMNRLKAHKLEEEGGRRDAAEAEPVPLVYLRDYDMGAQILADLGLGSIRILTSNPRNIDDLQGFGLRVTDQVLIEDVS